ncbi:MAG: efflux RND transporter periplasmic adaptor subunit [Alphaproteobacteria bacterium]|nr:efflux RND transporter periplasmic adaptor subunit [Alphaproteobacteria bacterium]
MKAAVSCLLFAAVVFVSDGSHAQESKGSAPNVTVATIASQAIGHRGRYVGRVKAVDTVNLVARVQGFLEKREFEEGSFVKKGELLYVIEKSLFEANVASAKAQLEGAQATLKNSTINLDRQKFLLSKDDVPQSTVDSATATVGANQASVDEAKANLDTANINLGYTNIISPIDGRISQSLVDVGNLVDTNTGTLATVTSVDPIYVSFFVGEKELIEDREKGLIGNNSAELDVKLTLSDGSGYPLTGKISYVDTAVQENSDTIELRATFDNPKNILIPNQFVNVNLAETNPPTVVVVPQSAVQLDSKGHFVYVLDSANKIERKDVQLGRQAGAFWVVTSGLQDGEKVVVQGLQRVSPGMVVNPTEQKQ